MFLRIAVILTLSFLANTHLIAFDVSDLEKNSGKSVPVSLPNPDKGEATPSCSFCQIAGGKHTTPDGRRLNVFWETNTHIAWLDKNPNTPGASLLIPKEHLPSNFEDVPLDELTEAMGAAQIVSRILNTVLHTDRTVPMIVGFQVPHFHVRLYPKEHPGSKKCIVSNERGEPRSEEELEALERDLIAEAQTQNLSKVSERSSRRPPLHEGRMAKIVP